MNPLANHKSLHHNDKKRTFCSAADFLFCMVLAGLTLFVVVFQQWSYLAQCFLSLVVKSHATNTQAWFGVFFWPLNGLFSLIYSVEYPHCNAVWLAELSAALIVWCFTAFHCLWNRTCHLIVTKSQKTRGPGSLITFFAPLYLWECYCHSSFVLSCSSWWVHLRGSVKVRHVEGKWSG